MNYTAMKTTELRTIAREFGMKQINGRGVHFAKKAELIEAIEAQADSIAAEIIEERTEAQEEIRNETYAAEAKALEEVRAGYEKAARERIRNQKCEVCEVKKIDGNTQGIDSTMCTECFDAAGVENDHFDGNHEDDPREYCPLCEESKPKSLDHVEYTIEHPKAKRFAEFAKAHGWEVVWYMMNSDLVQVTVHSSSRKETIDIWWSGRVFQYDMSSHRRDNKNVKVRNVSAARMVIEAV